MKALTTQRAILGSSMKTNNNSLNNLKSKISRDFSRFNTENTLKNIDSYLKLKKEYNYSRVYIIFIDQIITQYSYLNSYNKILLDTLINNKEAIIKDAHIVIPSS